MECGYVKCRKIVSIEYKTSGRRKFCCDEHREQQVALDGIKGDTETVRFNKQRRDREANLEFFLYWSTRAWR